MGDPRRTAIKPWMLFAFPAAIAVPIVAGILLGGPVVGFLVAAVVGLVIVAFAIGVEPRVRLTAAEWCLVPCDGVEDLLAAADRVLERTGDRVMACPRYGRLTARNAA